MMTFIDSSHAKIIAIFLILAVSGVFFVPKPTQAITLSYSTAGLSSLVVPEGVTSITAKLWGAGGGGGVGSGAGQVTGGSGGGAGYMTGTITVTPGETITVLVGSGGAKGAATTDGGDGGGFSALRRGASTYLFIAAGGGGGGGMTGNQSNAYAGGGGGGQVGKEGNFGSQTIGCTPLAAAGCGGTQTAGGAGGTGWGTGADGTAGASLAGGNGGAAGTGGAGGTGGGGSGNTNGNGGGGGGGGGFFGGGGGENGFSATTGAGGGGGGGGSSFATSTTATATSTVEGNTGAASSGTGPVSGGTAGNSSDPQYTGNAGLGGTGASTAAAATAGNDGLVVITFTTSTGVEIAVGAKFLSNLDIRGTLSKGSGTFVIDHPQYPATKLLYHSFVESPDVKNLYDGIAKFDKNGEATIKLPDYFEALNKDFRYQFFAIDEPMPNLHIKKEVESNQFTIGGGAPGGEVSWQITGSRHDPYILANPIQVEVEKGPDAMKDKGECLYEAACQDQR